MKKNKGFLKLHRQTLDSKVWQGSPALFKVFCYCLLKASRTSRTWTSWSNGGGSLQVMLHEGQFIFGRNICSAELKIPPSTVLYQLKKLEQMGNISISVADNLYSLITVNNYRRFQHGPGIEYDNQTDLTGVYDNQKTRGDVVETTENKRLGRPSIMWFLETITGGATTDNKRDSKKRLNRKDVVVSGNTNGHGTLRNASDGHPKNKFSANFEAFWKLYPKKQGKLAAYKRWKKINPDPVLQSEMAQSLILQSKSRQWSTSRFIPHAATWLNGERWNDQLDPEENYGKNQWTDL